jgi:hypothetical protein
MALGIGVVSLVDALAVLGVFACVGLDRYPDSLAHAQTIAFATLCLRS